MGGCPAGSGRACRDVAAGTVARCAARQRERERRALALHGPDPDLAAVRGGDVLDDREAQAGAARRRGAARGRRGRTARRSGRSRSAGMPMPWSVTVRSTISLVGPGARPRRVLPLGGVGDRVGDQVAQRQRDLVAVAEDLQPALAVVHDGDRPWTGRRCCSGRSPRATMSSTSTVCGSSSGSSPCSRDSSMICCTSLVSRALSVCIRPENRGTASGSSAPPAPPRRAG